VACTSGGFYGALVLQRLRACDRIEICAIVRSSRVLDPGFGFLRGALAQVRRSGFAYALYLWCATTLADWLCGARRIGRVRMRAPTTPVLTTRDVNDRQGLQFLADCRPDLLVSFFFNQRLCEAALAIPALGCLNIHPSLLPAFKGVDPVFQARYHGGSPIGVTVHFMSPELDAGKILAQRQVAAPAEASIFETTALLFGEGADLLAAQIDRVERGQTGTAQSGPGSYQSWPSRDEVRALRARGQALVRASDLMHLLTGRTPRSGA